MYGILCRFNSQQKKSNKVEDDVVKRENNVSQVSSRSKVEKKKVAEDSGLGKYNSDDEDLLGDSKWKLELAWLSKALEPALQLYRWALPTGLFVHFTMIWLLAELPIRNLGSLCELSD